MDVYTAFFTLLASENICTFPTADIPSLPASYEKCILISNA